MCKTTIPATTCQQDRTDAMTDTGQSSGPAGTSLGSNRLGAADVLARRLDRPMGILGVIFLFVVLGQLIATEPVMACTVAAGVDKSALNGALDCNRPPAEPGPR